MLPLARGSFLLLLIALSISMTRLFFPWAGLDADAPHPNAAVPRPGQPAFAAAIVDPLLSSVGIMDAPTPPPAHLRGTAERNPFARGSSLVDWCEQNYDVTQFVAEFYNTVSNIPFVFLPPVSIYLYGPYAKRVDPGINIVWALLLLVGVGSGYFHATLSFSGQLFDEWAILWVLMTATGLWLPDPWIPRRWPCRGSRTRLKQTVFLVAIVGTAMSVVYPVANAPLLLCFVVPMLGIVKQGFDANKAHDADGRMRRLTLSSVFWVVLAVCCWVNDRLFCLWWTQWFRRRGLSYPQLHAAWHATVLLAAYMGCVLGSFFKARRDVPHLRPRIAWFPFDKSEVGIPFVAVDFTPVWPRKKHVRRMLRRIPGMRTVMRSELVRSASAPLLSLLPGSASSRVDSAGDTTEEEDNWGGTRKHKWW